MPRLHRAKTVACGLLKWGKCVWIMVVHSVTRGWQDIRILLGVMGAIQPPIPYPTEGCLVISVMRSSRHFSKTYPRKGDEGRGSGREVVGDRDRRYEPVPSAVHGLNAPRRPWMVPHRLANLAYTH